MGSCTGCPRGLLSLRLRLMAYLCPCLPELFARLHDICLLSYPFSHQGCLVTANFLELQFLLTELPPGFFGLSFSLRNALTCHMGLTLLNLGCRLRN